MNTPLRRNKIQAKKKSLALLLLRSISFISGLAVVSTTHADLVMYEGSNYELEAINPDPDGGLNGGNGLPFPGSTGFRSNGYGLDTKVVANLDYTNAGGTLNTSGNALQRFSGTGWSNGTNFPYRFMTDDPFTDYRSTAPSTFGWNGSFATELYYSVLLNWSAINTGADNRMVVKLGRDNSNFNTYLSQNGPNLNFGDQLGNSFTFAPAVAGETVLIVARLRFESATTFITDYWFNPVLGAPLETPSYTQTYGTAGGGGQFNGIQTRDGANILTFDEFRVGTTATSVMAMSGVAAPSAPTVLAATANSFSEVSLSWVDNASNEIDFVIERSLNGTTGWRQIAIPAANSTAFTDSGLSAQTTYHYRIRAANGGGGSAFSNIAVITTPSSAVATPPPSNLAGTVNSFSEITLNWIDNTSDETSFTLQSSPDGTTDWTTLATLAPDVTAFQHTGLAAATTYHYRISATSLGGVSLPSNVASVTTSALPALVALPPISLPFDDEDGISAFLADLVPGITAYSGSGVIKSTSALTYPGISVTGNGLETVISQRYYFTLDTTLPGLAHYVSGGQIGGSGLGVLYVRWLARGINAQEGNTVDFRTAAIDLGGVSRASVGTTFSNAFIRAMASSTSTSGINTFVNTALAPSAGTDLYVARFTFAADKITTMDLFVNQTTEGIPDATITGAIVFNTIGFSKFGPAAVPSIDEFRIGTSWADAVGIALNPIQTWFGSFGLPTDGTGTGAFNADPDGDGISNLLEYAFKGNPTVGKASILPSTGQITVLGLNYLTLTFERLTAPSNGVTYTPQASADLADWSGVPVQMGAAVNNNDGTETVVFRDSLPLNNNPKRFLRVRVTAP